MPPVRSNDANTRTYPSMIHWRSETVAPSLRWIVGRAMLTTVLSSIAIARAKHIVRRTMTFSRAFSPLNPNSGMHASFLADTDGLADPDGNIRDGAVVPYVSLEYRRIESGMKTARSPMIHASEISMSSSVEPPLVGYCPTVKTRARFAQCVMGLLRAIAWTH